MTFWVQFEDRKVEMVSFELGEELRKMIFRLVTSVGQKKFWVLMRNRTSSPSSKLAISTFLSKTLLYRRCWSYQYAGCVSLKLRNRLHSPKSLCGLVVEHRSANPKVWDSIPHGGSEFLFVPRSWQDEKTSFLIWGQLWSWWVFEILFPKICSYQTTH